MKLLIEVPEGYMVQVVKEEKDSRSVTPEWLAEQEKHFKGVDLQREFDKAKNWCRQKKRHCTRRFFVNWLNRVDPEFYHETARRDIMNEVADIKARGFEDAMGWTAKNEKDAARLKELRTLYKTIK